VGGTVGAAVVGAAAVVDGAAVAEVAETWAAGAWGRATRAAVSLEGSDELVRASERSVTAATTIVTATARARRGNKLDIETRRSPEAARRPRREACRRPATPSEADRRLHVATV
jgi:hypothetical protein